MMNYRNIEVVAFDADDTLWANETYFRQTEEEFCGLLVPYAERETVAAALLRTETANVPLYGYGAKGCTLSMIETALAVGGGGLPPAVVARILELGRSLLEIPVTLLDGVRQTLDTLRDRYRLVVATKGDLLDQRRKLERSGIDHYFEHAEIMPDKNEAAYAALIAALGIPAERFLMVGNSLRSDIYPVLEVGAKAVHVPFHVTWQHEVPDGEHTGAAFATLESLAELPALLRK